MNYAFVPAPIVSLPVLSGQSFPVRRIFCVGQNYADHVREMGSDPQREEPIFFNKLADTILANHSALPYPPATFNLHHEIELVVALKQGGSNIAVEAAEAHIFGYAVGLDMTRRDLQETARAKGNPWDMSKSFDNSAPIAAITPASQCGILSRGSIELKVNGKVRQHADVADMIWSIPEIISRLSQLIELHPGDLIFTGTPAGVGPVVRGDRLEAKIAGLETLVITVT